ncbi:unnamed protein product [Medioppia subpectinata]|uniref:SH3 domain-containing protein n=1 Tax=Medioppia subpectinata TaxID=1979941 RepID=A0A7R9KI20_9ACAR|nr:unnamed protein product [Medioppia subpectinata]CAG2102844.1 unnamed protein product [Medioppia subpectinata]
MKNRRAKVVYSYAPQNDDELKLEVDEVIEVLDEIEDGWWKGVSPKGITGVFPSNFVVEVTADSPKVNKKEAKEVLNDKNENESKDDSKSSLNRDGSLEKKPKPINKIGFGDIFAGGIKPKLSPIGDTSLERNKNLPKKPPPQPPAPEPEIAPKLPPKPVREQAMVLYTYVAQNEDELSIKEGEIINIVSKEIEDVGWWKGELNGRIALFPDNFVEIIKTPEESNSTPRVKKPGRPAEKPPPPIASNQSSNASTNQPKLESNKSSNKPTEELPKSTVAANSSSAPVIPGKKPKVLNSSLFQSKPKPEPTQTPTPSKPDVVPQENGTKHDKDVETTVNNNKSNVSANSNNTSENNFVDSTANKLTHLTANRPKGPSSRRPPSTIFIPKDSANESNGDISVVSNKIEANNSHTNDHIKPSNQSLSQTPPDKDKPEKLPPWMLELRKAQEKRKDNPEDSPKVSLNSPTKSSPNRFSGDFSNKSLQNSTTEEKNESNSTPLFKPLKSTKPHITPNAVTSSVPSTPTTTTTTTTETPPPVATVVAPTTTSSKTTNIVINSPIMPSTATTTTTSKVDESVTNSTSDKRFAELEKQLKELKESTVSRKEFEELSKQVTELKEAVDTQKLTYSKTIRDLINDVADEQKKVATLQIEIERLRKLTTTV